MFAGIICAAAQPVLRQAPLGFGYTLNVCLLFGGPPTGQIGVMWASPFISSVQLPMGGGCFTIPYLPFLPQRGQLVFPP